MKKRLLSMLVCAFILVPVFLTGCSDTDETLTVEQTRARLHLLYIQLLRMAQPKLRSKRFRMRSMI